MKSASAGSVSTHRPCNPNSQPGHELAPLKSRLVLVSAHREVGALAGEDSGEDRRQNQAVAVEAMKK
jgi:hypothetical protein